MTANHVLSVIIAITVVLTWRTFHRLLWMRDRLNEKQDLLTVFHESLQLGLTSFMWFQVLLLSSAFELVRGSSLLLLHIAGLFAQIVAVNLAATLRITVQPYILDLNILRAYQTLREKKAAARRNKTARR